MFVYLDTNVYLGAKLVFDRDKFDTLKSYIMAGIVKLLYSSATLGEVFHHIEEDIEREVVVYNLSIRKKFG